MKTFIKVLLSLVVVLIVAGIAAYLGRNVIAAGVIRTAASAALGVKVDVASVDLDLGTPGIKIYDLEVGNPPGYAPPHALTAGLISVSMNAAETTTQKIVVDSVTLDKVGAWFVMKGDTNNISQLLATTSSTDAKGDSKGMQIEVVIKKVVLTNLEAHASLTGDTGADLPVVAVVERIEMENITSKGGMSDTGQQLSAKIFEITMQATVSAVGKQLPGAITAGVGKSLEGAGVAIGKTTQVLGEAAGKAAESAGKAVGDAAKGLGGLLGGDKK